MRKDLEARIAALEASIRSLYEEQLFEEWFEEHATDADPNDWSILNVVPKEMRLDCVFRLISNAQRDASRPSPS